MVPNFNKLLLPLALVSFIDIRIWVEAELFTAISEVEPLLETHKRIVDDLDDYIKKEETRIAILKKNLERYKIEHEKAMEDIPNYLGNPINAFTLIKRLTTDLDYIEQSINIGTEYIKNITITYEDVQYPSLEDLTGAARALTRLQATYHLDVAELADGMLNGVIYSTPMTTSDCYELGRALYNERDYENSIAWMKAALRKHGAGDNEAYDFDDVNIMDYISFAYYLKGDVSLALEWTQALLSRSPNHERARNNVPHYKQILEDLEQERLRAKRGDTGDSYESEERSQGRDTLLQRERRNYEALCRGEMDISPEISKNLNCFYLSSEPTLRLSPIRVEQRYASPDVYVFYNVLSDDEIDYLMEMAKPRFRRAVVHDPKTGELVPADYRISKSAWLRDSESPVVARVSRRIAAFTGLSLAYAEDLQVVNYGIGGHYEPHYDFARKSENAFAEFNGNRIATVLFYMSDVAQGGATVFTELGLSVKPIRGAALFWLNLRPSGAGDLATRHAACPVLRGTKWVCNKWIHEGGQELIRPCDLENQEEDVIRKIVKPIPKSSR